MTEKTLKTYIRRAAELAEELAEKRKAYEKTRAAIIEAMDAQDITEERAGKTLAKLSHYSIDRVDTKRLKTEAPDIYNKFSNTRAETRLTFKDI